MSDGPSLMGNPQKYDFFSNLFLFLSLHKCKNGAILDWTIVKLVRFSPDCKMRYIEMSDEEIDMEFEDFKKRVMQCKIIWNECKRRKFEYSEHCPSLSSVLESRENNSPRFVEQNFPFLTLFTAVLMF